MRSGRGADVHPTHPGPVRALRAGAARVAGRLRRSSGGDGGGSDLQQVLADNRRLSLILDNSRDLITVLDDELVIRYESAAVARFGWDPDELVGRPGSVVVHPDDLLDVSRAVAGIRREPGASTVVTWRARTGDGDYRHVESVVLNVRDDPELAGYLWSTRDLTERRTLERRLEEQALHDPLTGLASRRCFQQQLAELHLRDGAVGHLALCHLDLDDFVEVNRRHGYDAGDQLLLELGRRLRAGCELGPDAVARLGADEFAVAVWTEDTQMLAATVERLAAAVRAPVVREGGSTLRVEVSIGVALLRPGWSVGEQLHAADAALYEVKASGKGHWRLYRDAVASTRLHAPLLADLQRALDRDEFVLHLQPICELDSGRPVGFEALARWAHPTRGLLPPSEFIPLAEQGGVIGALDMQVLDRACRLWQRLPNGARARPGLSLNLSAAELRDPAALTEGVTAALARTGVAPDTLTLEVTESALVGDLADAAKRLADLRRLGVRLAVDDFGAGHAGFGYLHHLPVDALKVDGSFVAGLGHNARSAALVETMVALADRLEVTCIAEGIERPGQLEHLRRLGCGLGQGYLLGRPAPEPEDPAGLLTLRPDARP